MAAAGTVLSSKAKSNRQSKGSASSGSKRIAESENIDIAEQLQVISNKLSKLDELEKLNKDLLKTVLQLTHRVDLIAQENRQLKQVISDLQQERLCKELVVKGIKLERPGHHTEICQKICDLTGFDGHKFIREVKPIILKENKATDAVIIKFWHISGKTSFASSIRKIGRPLLPRDVGVTSPNKRIILHDNLTKEKRLIHNRTKELCKLGLKSLWI